MAFDTTHDIVPDSPTNVFATLNPLFISDGTNQNNPTNGNLYLTTTSAGREAVRSTFLIPKNSGKWYWEFVTDNNAGGSGITINQYTDINDYYYGDYNWVYYGGGIFNNGSQVTALSSTPSTNTVIGVMVDLDNNLIYFYSGGSSLGSASITSNQDWIPIVGDGSGAISTNVKLNFGQDHTFGGYPNSLASSSGYSDAKGLGQFYYDPKQIASDVKALCAANLPDPAIDPNVDDLPEDNFVPVAYAGQNSNLTINSSYNLGFTPDLIFIKWRSGVNSSNSWMIFDSVRGFSNYLQSDNANVESNSVSAINSVSSSGVVLNHLEVTNQSGANYVAYFWKAGGSPSGSTSTTGSAKRINTSGTQDDTSCSALATAASTAGASNVITPTLMSINQKAGFSIIKYTGTGSAATIPHGLSSAPEMVICKTLSQSIQWVVYHKDTGPDGFLGLNTTTGFSSDTDYWGTGTGVTNAVFGLQNAAGGNNHTSDLIAYCWHSVAGYSAFGSYEGSTALPFVYTGFKPSFLLLKNADDSASWVIHDNARDAHNEVENVLVANASSAETTYSSTGVDFLSNGFKMRGGSSWYGNNLSTTQTVIYAAFAEQPTKYATAR